MISRYLQCAGLASRILRSFCITVSVYFSEVSSDGMYVLAPGEPQPLDAFLKTQSIAAHRPPHIPALRMLPDLATVESSDSFSFAARMPQLPAIQPISESSSFETDEVQQRSWWCTNSTGFEVHPALAGQRECSFMVPSPNSLYPSLSLPSLAFFGWSCLLNCSASSMSPYSVEFSSCFSQCIAHAGAG